MTNADIHLAAAAAANTASSGGATARGDHDRMANAIRILAMDGVEQAKSGHPGLPMGAADVATVLFTQFLSFDPADPKWPDRDRFVLSAGHGSMLLYSLLYLLGYEGMTIDQLKHFRQMGSRTPGHPENFHTIGIETTTGPLGQGLANAVGMAIAERHLNAEYGDSIVDHRTYVLCSDGDLMEGISQEAIALAGHLKLNKLIFLYDDNHISIDGPTSLADSVDQVKRFEAAGWSAGRIDGHDPDSIAAALEAAQTNDRPTMIACRTQIAFGAPNKQGSEKAHGAPLGADEIKAARVNLGWTDTTPFDIPKDILALWHKSAKRGETRRVAWQERLKDLEGGKRAEFTRRMAGDVAKDKLDAAILTLKQSLKAEPKEIATRIASENALNVLVPAIPELVGGSADLTGSNNTRAKGMKALCAEDYAGRFIHYGVREHGMAAAMNGMALHGGVIPYSGGFLIFSDYCRPSIRLASLMNERVIHVMTHDSIGLGEDGPTHQPVEHLAALRAMPNLHVLRPCDTIETAECWQIAITSQHNPSILVLTRQNLPQLRHDAEAENRCARGAYELVAAGGKAEVSLFATGSEVSIAVEAQKLLATQGVKARVVSVPCFELFFDQSEDYRAKIIGDARVKVGVEAAVRQGWDAIIGSEGGFVGMSSFGESAPYKELYKHFGITPEAVAALAQAKLGKNVKS